MNILAVDCRNPTYQRAVANHHHISVQIFDQYKRNFWAGVNPMPVVRSWSTLEAMMGAHECATKKWALYADEHDHQNNEIAFSFEDIQVNDKEVNRTEFTFKTNYRFEVFYGVRLLDAAQEFRFFKAIDADGRYTIIFEVLRGDGSLQWYDLSNMDPIDGEGGAVSRKMVARTYDCTLPADQDTIARNHSNAAAGGILETYIANFWGSYAQAQWKDEDWSYFDGEMKKAGVHCTTHRWRFDTDDTLAPNIMYATEPVPVSSGAFLLAYSTNYSFMLLSGIERATGAATFSFTKANRGVKDYAIIIKVTDGGGIEYLYDLSNMYP